MKYIKLFLISLVIGALIGFTWNRVEAWYDDDDYQEECEEYDWEECIYPTPTSTPVPTNTPVPTVTPTLEPTATPSATPTISPTPTIRPIDECDGDCEQPTATPTPTLEPEKEATPSAEFPFPQPQNGVSSGGFSQCQGTAPAYAPANFHVYRNGDQAVARWYYDANVSWRVVVYYGLTGQGDQHSVLFENKPGSGLIEGLGNRDFDFRAVFTDGCVESKSTSAVIDGNTSGWVLFR